MKNRLQYMDILKFFAIFLVLWGHAIQFLTSGDFWDKPVYRAIYSFHMPLFMAISGFLFAMTSYNGFKKTAIRRFRQLVLPSICWLATFTLLPYVIAAQSEQYTLQELTAVLIEQHWFLKSAFFCVILGCPVKAAPTKSMKIASALVTLIISQFTGYYQICVMYPCFLSGAILFTYRDAVHRNITAVLALSFIIFASCNLFLDAATYQQCLSTRNNAALFADPVTSILSRAYYLTMGIAGTYFFINIFGLIFAKATTRPSILLMSNWGQYTLGIYILQYYILERLLPIYLNFDNVSSPVFNFIIAPAAALAVIAVSVAIIKIAKRNQWISALYFGTEMPSLRPQKKRQTSAL